MVCTGVPDKPRIGEQLGYLSRELAEELAPRVDDGEFLLMGEILDVSGGHDGESVGVNYENVGLHACSERHAPPATQETQASPESKAE